VRSWIGDAALGAVSAAHVRDVVSGRHGGPACCSGRCGRVAGPCGKGDVARAHASTAHPGGSWLTLSVSGVVPGPPSFTTPTRPLEKNSAPSSVGSPLSATVRRGIRPPVLMRSCGCKPASVVFDELLLDQELAAKRVGRVGLHRSERGIKRFQVMLAPRIAHSNQLHAPPYRRRRIPAAVLLSGVAVARLGVPRRLVVGEGCTSLPRTRYRSHQSSTRRRPDVLSGWLVWLQ